MKIIKNLIFLLVVCISGKIALAQQNDPPQWTWAKNVGGSAISMTSDSIGNSYVVGLHSSNVTFGSTTLAGSGVYVVKYDSTGAVLWARQAATGLVDPKDIAVDALGDYYITGSFSG
ncbi:MAG: hypothetical protein K0R65_1441, partial [Crocinitomicaceae bacterium]|nr:hypothetical protein [Crocinitomicaceae bacterium]